MKLVDETQSLPLDLRALVGTFWPALSAADLDWIQAREDRLLHAIVRTYGLDRLTAERQIFSFVKFIRWNQLEQRLRSDPVAEETSSAGDGSGQRKTGGEISESHNRLSGPAFHRKRNLQNASRNPS